jgi:hypothetical protein
VDCAAPQVAGTFFSARKLQRILDRRGRIPHRSLINDIVAETAIGVQSPLEYRWIKHVGAVVIPASWAVALIARPKCVLPPDVERKNTHRRGAPSAHSGERELDPSELLRERPQPLGHLDI